MGEGQRSDRATSGRTNEGDPGGSAAPRAPAALRAPAGPGDGRVVRGRSGEHLAERWYRSQGYEVLERNWRRQEGEVDLIVARGRTVAFCEVKLRTSDRFGAGSEAVSDAKQRRIRRLASRWLAEVGPAPGRARSELRFDVVSITSGRVEVIEGAF